MLDQLSGCREKLLRAEEHLNTLYAEVTDFSKALRQGKPYTVGSNVDPDTGNQTAKLILPEPVPTLRWGAVAGDVVHNLRSVLDHIIEELTIRNHGSAIAKTEFPIFTREFGLPSSGKGVSGIPGFRDMKPDGVTPRPDSGLHKIRGIRQDFQTLIEQAQPYWRLNDVNGHPLLILHKLDISDKHRVLPVVAAGTRLATAKLGLGGGGPFTIAHLSSDSGFGTPFPLVDGAEIPGFTLSADTALNVDVNLDLSLQVTIDVPDDSQRPLRECLDELFLSVLWFTIVVDRMLDKP